MEPIHIFYKELPADENNVFTAKISEINEVENVKFRKSQEYGVTSLSIKPDISDSLLVTVKNVREFKFLSKKIQELVTTKEEPDLDLKISHGETKTLIIPFQKNQKQIAPL